MTEHDAEKFWRFGRRVENSIDRDLEFFGRRVNARLCLGELAPQLRRAVLDQLDKNFVLGFEVQVEGAEANVRLGRDVSDSRLMIALARNDTLGGLNQIDTRLLATAIESVWRIASLSSYLTHDVPFYREMNRVSITIIDSILNLYS